MTTADITRFLFQPHQYVGARSQQGRVLLDSDVNEGASLAAEDLRRILFDVIGPHGSPDDGFTVLAGIGDEIPIRNVAFNGAAGVPCLDYQLAMGALYVAGLRFEHAARPGSEPPAGDPVLFQRDFLTLDASLAPRPDPGNEHSQLTVLHGIERDVFAVEDEELREVALGGLDTSTRLARFAQVETHEVEPEDDCAAAWQAVQGTIEAAVGGTFDAAACELVSDARLRLAFVEGAAEDACSPCLTGAAGRYLGADNQTIRIMIAAPGRYVFGRDNASRLYRVRLGEAEDGRVPVEMLTEPRDETRWPLANTVMEFMGAGAILENGSTVRDGVGVFIRVARGYDPDTRTFLVEATDAAALDALVRQWDPAHPETSRLPDAAELFVRPWHRVDAAGDDILLDTAVGPGNHALLARLGLEPTFSGTGRVGDYWSAALRPSTPQEIVPWNLTQAGGVPPHGPRHFYAPLNRIDLRPPGPGEHANTEVVQSITDCRRRFRPLVDRAGCCTYRVGDGAASRGDYPSIQAAVDNLPAEGGRVCILPGRYRETVRIDRDNVVVEGCSGQTVLESPDGTAATALVHIVAENVTLKDLVLEPRGQIGVLVGAEAESAPVAARDVVIANVEAFGTGAPDGEGQARTVVDVRRAERVTLDGLDLGMDGALSDEAVVFVRGTDITVRGSTVECEPDGAADGPWGGIQIGGSSQRVSLLDNDIRGGVGHGVTLGSLVWVPEISGSGTLVFGAGAGQVNAFDPCAPRLTLTQAVEFNEIRYDPQSAGDLADITIADNRISGMSGNGISVLTTLALDDAEGEDLITVDRITIERNRIAGNIVQASALPAAAISTKPAKGGSGDHGVFGQFSLSSIPPGAIVLVDGEGVVIRDNDIRDNGTGDNDPVSGISITYGNAIVIDGNRILNNGLRAPGTTSTTSATRAGIMVSLAGVASDTDEQTVADPAGSSLRITGNIVSHPNGPALAARATGPMAVTGNVLESLGNNASAQPPGVAHCVALMSIGLPFAALELPDGEPSPERWRFPPRTPHYLQREPGTGSVGGVGGPGEGEPAIGYGGQVLFSSNQVLLNWAESGAGNVSGLESGFSVGICSLDHVVMTANQLALNVTDPGVKKTSAGVLSQRPRISAQAVVVGGTVSVSNNRIAEGVNDALMSLLALGGLLVSVTGNVTTHLTRVSTSNTFTPNSTEPPRTDRPDERVDRGNLVWLRPVAQDSQANLVSEQTVNSTANALFAALSDACLGLPVGGGNSFTAFTSLAVAFLPQDQ